MLNLATVVIEGSFKRASCLFGSLFTLECVCAEAGQFFFNLAYV